MDIGQILRHLKTTGIKKVEQIESNGDTETSWAITETHGAKTTFHVPQNLGENDGAYAVGNHVYL